MIKEQFSEKRDPRTEHLEAELVVVGGGLAGVCAAITAARTGVRVILVQDRPLLGGNASSEIRLWILGATSHMGNNNRWAREGGMVDEILVENMWRNPEGNPVIFDTILLEKVSQEANIHLLLNTVVYDLEKQAPDVISRVTAFCSQNSIRYILSAPFFCDASGDGIVAFQAGAAFRMGAEIASEFGEKFAPSQDYGELLGHSLYFYSKDTGVPVTFVPPAYALENITDIPRYRRLNAREQGCQLWWIEYGGRLDTVHDTEKIKWELWKVIYGVWDHIKNSGQFPEAETLTLEWVGMIPGKRESRRFEGDYILTQQDVVEQRTHADAVAFGGWSIDLHPADGVFSEKPACNQWHSKGIYQIPYRCLYSRNLRNLFLAGRIISVSHVAFGSSRVMATGAYAGQAAAMAAVLCLREKLEPRQLLEPPHMQHLQTALLKIGQFIPGLALHDDKDLVLQATLQASSEYVLQALPADGSYISLADASGQMLPLPAGPVPGITVYALATEDTWLDVELRTTSTVSHHTPDVTLQTLRLPLTKGVQPVPLVFHTTLARAGYVFICFGKNNLVSLQTSSLRMTGVLSVFNKTNPAVSNFGKQEPPDNIGMDAFEFWCPERRPGGKNLALQLSQGIAAFGVENIRNGINRPVLQPNAWLADPADPAPSLTITWEQPQAIREVALAFDTDWDHPMESVLMGHPERTMPFCVKAFTLQDEAGNILYQTTDNHQTLRHITLASPVSTRQLTLRITHMQGAVPPGLFGVRCYA
ncbi:FAD-dependent oxidoreductase [Chitinophaga costaii]|nr:FAD-dependent oxidoreductase [Chitinophaga costaii]